jgi:hypothetical protein
MAVAFSSPSLGHLRTQRKTLEKLRENTGQSLAGRKNDLPHARDQGAAIMMDDVIVCCGGAKPTDKHLASKIHCVDDEKIGWLERRERFHIVVEKLLRPKKSNSDR